MNASVIRELVRPEVPTLPPYNAGLSSEAVRSRYGIDRIARLASNENPFGASPAVARALADLALRVGTYPDANCTVLRAAIAERTSARAEQIVIGNGSESILQMLCQAFLSPGDRVLTQRPAFGLHEIYPRMMGAQVELLALTPSLEFDLDAWCEALGRGPKIAMLANEVDKDDGNAVIRERDQPVRDDVQPHHPRVPQIAVPVGHEIRRK